MRNFLKEFQAFISKGNVMDLAVAVIIGAAFSNIVNSLVKDIVNPILGVLVGRPDFTNLFVVLKPVEGYTGPQTYEALVKAGATVFGYGAFLTAVVQFLLLAFVIFWLIKVVTTIRKRLEAEAAKLLKAEEEKKAAEDATAENKALFDAMKDALNGKVKEVKVSIRLKDHPVCLSADGPLSIEMEKVLSKQPGSEGVKSDKVLELNVNHPVFAALKAAQEAGDTEKLNKYSTLLYAQAQLIEGLPVDDPAAYAEAVCSLMK